MADSPKTFGHRGPPATKARPPVTHAPQGLGGPEPHDKRRLRSLVVFLTTCGVATIFGLALIDTLRGKPCPAPDPNDWNAPKADPNCRSGGHGGGGGHGGWSFGGSSGQSSVSFGGFGSTGAGGAHGGGGGE
jgi:uncharacterized membrane protein YgcG